VGSTVIVLSRHLAWVRRTAFRQSDAEL